MFDQILIERYMNQGVISMETCKPGLIDRHNRLLNYLRISVTDRCNLRCLYCMPLGSQVKLRHEDILTFEEILRLAGIAIDLGIDRIRVTGGEPLVRKGIREFLPLLGSLKGLSDISITTNGVYLIENIDTIRSSGIKRINISLDTLNREKYKKITGHDSFEAVWEGIDLARKLGFQPIKINVVVMQGINDDEVVDLARLSQRYPYCIRFIEYMPISVVKSDTQLISVSNSWIKEKLGKLGKLVRTSKNSSSGPAECYRLEGAPGEIGFISPMTHHFCRECNRLRITASGHLRPCLLSDLEEDLKNPMRSGASDQDLAGIFLRAAKNKPRGHHLASEHENRLTGQMSTIGG